MAHDENEKARFPDFDMASHRSKEKIETKPVAFWIPVPSKAKFEQLQGLSGNAYGRFLQDLIAESIERTCKKYGI